MGAEAQGAASSTPAGPASEGTGSAGSASEPAPKSTGSDAPAPQERTTK